MDSLERCEGLASWDDPECGAFDIEDIRSVLRELRSAREAVKRTVSRDKLSKAAWNDALRMVDEKMKQAR